MTRFYVGVRGQAGCQVSVIDESGAMPLSARTPHPLISFNWGRSGRSAQELAWAILFDCSKDVVLAGDRCIDFTVEVVARLPREAFDLPARAVIAWLNAEGAIARRALVSARPSAALPDGF